MDLASLLNEDEDTFEDVNLDEELEDSKQSHRHRKYEDSKKTEPLNQTSNQGKNLKGPGTSAPSERKDSEGRKRRKPSWEDDHADRKEDRLQFRQHHNQHHSNGRAAGRMGGQGRGRGRWRGRGPGRPEGLSDRERFEKLKKQVCLHKELQEQYRSLLNAPKELLKIQPAQKTLLIVPSSGQEDDEEEEEGQIQEDAPEDGEEDEEGAIEEEVKNFSDADVSLLAERICAVLDERKVETMSEAIRQLGLHMMMDLLAQTMDIEKSGGMLTADQTKRRATGGVFFTLLKDRIEKSVYKEIMGTDKRIRKQLQQKYAWCTSHKSSGNI